MNQTKNKSEPQKQNFSIDDWLSEHIFKVWFVKDKDNTQAQCFFCHKSIDLLSSGCAALTDHAKGKKYAVKKISTYFTPEKKPVW